MSVFTIPATATEFNLKDRFGSKRLELKVAEKIFYNFTGDATVRKVASSLSGTFTLNSDETKITITSISGTMAPGNTRVGEKVLILDSSDAVYCSGIVRAKSASEVTIDIVRKINMSLTPSKVEFSVDDYIEVDIPVELNTVDFPLFYMASETGATANLITTDITKIKKKD